MEKIIYEPMTIKDWSVFIMVISVPIILLALVNPYLLLTIPLIWLWGYFENKQHAKYIANLLNAREHDSICIFARSFNCKKIDTWIIRAVYEELEKNVKFENKSFPIKPDDNIFETLKIDEEDFEFDIIEDIATRTGRSLEKLEKNSFFGKVNTASDLVYFFNEQPKLNET